MIADDVTRAWRDGLRPDPDLTVSAWADKHRRLTTKGASEAGPWRTARTPYLREIMDALSPQSPIQRVVLMKGSQVGATEAGSNWIGYVIHHAPGPMLVVQPTVDLAKRYSKQRIDELIEQNPVLSERISPARERDSGNTMLAKEFPGGILVLTGSNSAAGLKSMPVRYLFLDEVDEYPPNLEDQGDAVSVAIVRTRTFTWRRKIFIASSPTVKGASRIETEFEATDRRYYFVPCPHCGHMQRLVFERLRWEEDRPETAAYYCIGCDKPISEHHKTKMFAAGRWVPTAHATTPHTVGYHLSGLYSPVGWLSWEELARDWVAGAKHPEKRRTTINTMLGETYQEAGEAPSWEEIYSRRDGDWAMGDPLPERLRLITAGADVQNDRIEVSIWGWGEGLESWLIAHRVIGGGPQSAECWQSLTDLMTERFQAEDGLELPISRLAIDTGYEAAAVYAWVRRQSSGRAAAVKGVDGFARSAPVLGPSYIDVTEGGRKIRRGVRLWTVAGAVFKRELYRFMRQADDDGPAGTVHLPADVDSEVVQQLVAEQLMTVKTRRGFTRLEWQKMRERNEALDCRVYARAAAWIAGVDRFTPERWQRIRAGVARPMPAPAVVAPDAAQQQPAAPRADNSRLVAVPAFVNDW